MGLIYFRDFNTKKLQKTTRMFIIIFAKRMTEAFFLDEICKQVTYCTRCYVIVFMIATKDRYLLLYISTNDFLWALPTSSTLKTINFFYGSNRFVVCLQIDFKQLAHSKPQKAVRVC